MLFLKYDQNIFHCFGTNLCVRHLHTLNLSETMPLSDNSYFFGRNSNVDVTVERVLFPPHANMASIDSGVFSFNFCKVGDNKNLL